MEREQKFKDKVILIIDDNIGDLKLMEEALREIGFYSISFADRASTGISKAKILNPDIIIVDMHLPDSNGFLVSRAIKLTTEVKSLIISVTGMKNSPYLDELAVWEDDWSLPDRFVEKTNDLDHLKKAVTSLV